MINQNKKGQDNLPAIIIGGFFFVLFIILAIFTFVNYSESKDFLSAFNSAAEGTVSLVPQFFTPILKLLLGLEENGINNALIILSFILVFMVILGALNFSSIFGETASGKLINFVVSIIVSAIGIRFMPSDMWVSLIAPSSGLVATILMLVPFALVLGLTLFSKNTWFSKLAWIFYVVFTSVLIFNISTGQFSLIYGIFLFCAVIMSIFDGTVRKFIRREQEKVHLAEGLSSLDVKLRNQLKQEIDDYYKIYNDPNTSEPDRKIALKKINSLKARYSKLGNF